MSSDLETRLSFTSLHFAGKRSTGRGPAPGRPLPPLGGGRSFGVRRSTPIFQNRGKQPLPTTTPKLLSIKARLSLSLSCLLACSALSPPPCAQRYSFLRAARSKSRNLLYARRRTGLLGELCCAALLSSFLPSAGEESANRLGPRPPPPYLVGGRRPWSLWSGLFPAAVPSSSLSLSLALSRALSANWLALSAPGPRELELACSVPGFESSQNLCQVSSEPHFCGFLATARPPAGLVTSRNIAQDVAKRNPGTWGGGAHASRPTLLQALWPADR